MYRQCMACGSLAECEIVLGNYICPACTARIERAKSGAKEMYITVREQVPEDDTEDVREYPITNAYIERNMYGGKYRGWQVWGIEFGTDNQVFLGLYEDDPEVEKENTQAEQVKNELMRAMLLGEKFFVMPESIDDEELEEMLS